MPLVPSSLKYIFESVGGVLCTNCIPQKRAVFDAHFDLWGLGQDCNLRHTNIFCVAIFFAGIIYRVRSSMITLISLICS